MSVLHPGLFRPLSGVIPGTSVVLRRISAGRDLSARLFAMGFVPGTTVEVRRNERHGPLLVAVKGDRIMLGRGMADKMMVE